MLCSLSYKWFVNTRALLKITYSITLYVFLFNTSSSICFPQNLMEFPSSPLFLLRLPQVLVDASVAKPATQKETKVSW